MPQSLRSPFLIQNLRTPMLFNGWLIDWVNIACVFFHFLIGNHLRFRLHFYFIRSTITMPISRLELAEFGRFVSGKYRLLKCADFEAYSRVQSINQSTIIKHGSAQTLRHILVFNQSINHRITWECTDFEASPRADFISKLETENVEVKIERAHGPSRQVLQTTSSNGKKQLAPTVCCTRLAKFDTVRYCTSRSPVTPVD